MGCTRSTWLSALAALAILDDAVGEGIIPLVSDINMPGMSGLDLLPIVKTGRPDLGGGISRNWSRTSWR
jgi:CheY-like chemotaxis protein